MPAIRIYVAYKLPRSAIPRAFLLPEQIEGVPTDVIESGRFRILPGSMSAPRTRLRPAQPGCSIGFQLTGDQAGLLMAGTFGAVVETNGCWHILSNNHVLARENVLPVGSRIFQPGLLDGGDPGADQIARLARFVALTPSDVNVVDCAIAEIDDRSLVRPTFLPRVGRLRGTIPVTAAEGMPVHKTGRATGYTSGTIFDVNADVVVLYGMGTLTFQDQILIRADRGVFADWGDSGAVIVDRNTKRATGLLFAGSRAYTLANPIATVLARLTVRMVR